MVAPDFPPAGFDVVELEPAVAEMARRCGAANREVLQHPKVHLLYNDGREVLLTTARKYDLILSEPSNPYRAGIASLYTKEYYQAVSGRLNSGGIFAKFVQAYEIDEETVRTILATMRSVFPHVEVWQTNPRDLLLVGCDAPPRYDASALRTRIAGEPYRTALRNTWAAWDLEGFLARFVAGPEFVDDLLREQPTTPNTDDRNRLEYSFARILGRQTGFSIETLRERMPAGAQRRPPVEGEVDWQRLEDQRQLMYGFALTPYVEAKGMTREQQTRAEVFRHYAFSDSKKMVEAYEAAAYEPASPAEAATLAMVLVLDGREGDRVERLLEKVQKELPDEAEIIRALQACRKNDASAAADRLVHVFEQMRVNPWIMTPVASAAVRAAAALSRNAPGQTLRLRAALAAPFAVEFLHEERCRALLALGALAGPAYACEDLQRFEPDVPWEEDLLRNRAQVYAAVHDTRAAQAARDLEEFSKNATVQASP